MSKSNADTFPLDSIDSATAWELSNKIIEVICNSENGMTYRQATELLTYTSYRLADIRISPSVYNEYDLDNDGNVVIHRVKNPD
jgi:hypothetical protein